MDGSELLHHGMLVQTKSLQKWVFRLSSSDEGETLCITQFYPYGVLECEVNGVTLSYMEGKG